MSVATDEEWAILGLRPQNSRGERTPSTLQIFDMAELETRVAQAGPRRWLFERLMVQGTHGVTGGASKSGKTTALTDGMVSAATGTPWLDHFPCRSPGPVLGFFGEGSESGMLRLLQAIVQARGGELGDLHGLVRIAFRVPRLSQREQVAAAERELLEHPAQLVVVDPAYLSLAGAKSSSLFEMGALLEPLQHICEGCGATLVLAWHWNQTGTGSGPARFTGVGAAEWGRFLGSAELVRRSSDSSGASILQTRWQFIGSEIPDITFGVRTSLRASDPRDPSSELTYEVQVTEADIAPSEPEVSPTRRRVLGALPAPPDAATVQEIGDHVALDGQGPALRKRTIERTLNDLQGLGVADGERGGRASGGIWTPARWWRT